MPIIVSMFYTTSMQPKASGHIHSTTGNLKVCTQPLADTSSTARSGLKDSRLYYARWRRRSAAASAQLGTTDSS